MGLNQEIVLPADFLSRMEGILGADYELFLASFNQLPSIGIRFNPFKPYSHRFENAENLQWESNALLLKERVNFTYDPAFHAGGYYVQEASSMLIGYIIKVLSKDQRWHLAIDICAAPGGKSTHIRSVLADETCLISNEIVSSRLGSLRQNMIKWGHKNVIVTSILPKNLYAKPLEADIVLLDAPCSGEGMFRKDLNSISHWSKENVMACSARQKDILQGVDQIIKKNGWLIYSTCTYNNDENINQIKNLLHQNQFICHEMPSLCDFGAVEIKSGDAVGYQCFPHLIKGEGLFICILQKKLDSSQKIRSLNNLKMNMLSPISKNSVEIAPDILGKMAKECWANKNQELFMIPEPAAKISAICPNKPLFFIGTIKGKKFIPSHELSMLPESSALFQTISLNCEESISFLKRLSFEIKKPRAKGWYIVQYEGLNLGFINLLESRVNNYFPNEWRILK